VRRTTRRLLSALTATAVLGGGAAMAPTATAAAPEAASPVAAAALPTGTPARTGPPASVAVLGDSISQATGSNGGGQDSGIGSPAPRNSWATGDWPGLNSNLQRIRALPGGAGAVGINLSANGANMRNDFYNQARTVPAGTQYVMVEMGGNDLCRSSEAAMTSEADYRAQFRAGLQWLQQNRPETLVYVASVPDIYNLWYIRGAAHQGEYFGIWPFGSTAAGPRATRGSDESGPFWARQFWDGLFGSAIPCQSLLVDPTQPRNVGPTPTPTHATEARRLRVRARTVAFNTILAQECSNVLRCRFDDNNVFNQTSNRLNGSLQSNRSNWVFRDVHISTQDHFHPSYAGQQELAGFTWQSSYDFRDTTAPSVTLAPATPANGNGWHRGNVNVNLSATDANGVRGLEFRVHQPSGAVGAWTQHLGATHPVPVTAEGTTHVEARALDVNGNLSASQVLTVRIDRTVPQVHLVSPPDGIQLEQHEALAAEFSCTDAGGSEIASCVGTVNDGQDVDTSTLGTRTFSVTATDTAGNQTTVTRSYEVIDVTDPTIDLRTPANGASFDRREDVEADFSCADEEGGSGLASCEGTVADGEPVPTGAIGDHDFTVEAADNAGNEAEVTHTYTVLDVTAPTIALTTPADGAVYDHHQVVNAAYTCEDDEGGSGIAPGYCEGDVDPGSPIDTTTLGNHTFTVTAIDRAGNEAEVSHTYTVRDVTAPTVSSSHRGIEYKLGQPVEAQFTCTDEPGGSGVATCAGPATLDTSSVGNKTFQVTAVDNAGNRHVETVGYTVIYAYGEIAEPINRDGSSVFKAGSTVPVKFEVSDFGTNPVGTATATLATVRSYSSEMVPEQVEEATTNVAATSGNLFRYDPRERQYIYNMSTRSMRAGTYQLFIALDDGKQYTAIITLR
jgi:lysophospholipase L1-like esterase